MGSRRSVGRFSSSVIFAFTRLACSSSSLIRRASLIAQCTTMAPPRAASDHLTSGDSKNVGIGSSNRIGPQTRLRRRHFRGGLALVQEVKSVTASPVRQLTLWVNEFGGA